MSSLGEQINEQLPWLYQELGFRLIADVYSPQAFGNGVVTLESDRLKLRFVQDRGQISAELASPTEPGWCDLTFVLWAIRGKQPTPSFDLRTLGSSVRAHFTELVEALGPKRLQTTQEIERIMNARRQGLVHARPESTGFRSPLLQDMRRTPGRRLLLRLLVWIVIMFVVWLIFWRHNSSSRLSLTAHPRTLKVAVFSDGRFTVEGLPASIESFRESLRRLHEQGGTVWYYRENAQRNPPRVAMEVMRAVIEARVPVRFSSRPDYSDSVPASQQVR